VSGRRPGWLLEGPRRMCLNRADIIDDAVLRVSISHCTAAERVWVKTVYLDEGRCRWGRYNLEMSDQVWMSLGVD
jgi:hypothetical protein